MNDKNNKLTVFENNQVIGYLHTNPFGFEYLTDLNFKKIGLCQIIPYQAGVITQPAVYSFFENLLPEGDERLSLEKILHISTVHGLLPSVGFNAIGNIFVSNQAIQKDEYKQIDWQLLAGDIDFSLDLIDDDTVIAEQPYISGAQHKVLLFVQDGKAFLPLINSPTTHILKPDIKKEFLRVWNSAVNETATMTLAHNCGLEVANVQYIKDIQSCLVERFDRQVSNNQINKFQQFDLCQLLNIPSEKKYENDGGPSFPDCYHEVINRSIQPEADGKRLIEWLFFNMYTGNYDSHAKNISMINYGDGLKLTPFYDLMCTRIYAGLSKSFAFKIGNTFKLGEVTPEDVEILANQVNVPLNEIIDIAINLKEKINIQLPDIKQVPVLDIGNGTNLSKELILLSRLTDYVKSNTAKLFDRVISQCEAKNEFKM